MPKRLADLNPQIAQAPGCPVRLRFTCPECGPPYLVDIPININGRSPAPNGEPTWAATMGDPPNFSWDTVTISPSINNTTAGHGRKKPCTWHGHIINGETRP